MVIGLISMPGWSSAQSRRVRPRFPGRAGDVRASRKIQLASRALDVQTFWPSMCQAPFSRHAWVRSAPRSDPAPGSENPWHQRSAPDSTRGRKRRFCSSVPIASSVLPIIFTLKLSVLQPVGAPAWAVSLEEHALLELAQPAPAVLSRPGHADQPVLVQQRTPSISERTHLIGGQRADPGPARRQRSGQEGAHLAPERLGLSRGGQVHGLFPCFFLLALLPPIDHIVI